MTPVGHHGDRLPGPVELAPEDAARRRDGPALAASPHVGAISGGHLADPIGEQVRHRAGRGAVAVQPVDGDAVALGQWQLLLEPIDLGDHDRRLVRLPNNSRTVATAGSPVSSATSRNADVAAGGVNVSARTPQCHRVTDLGLPGPRRSRAGRVVEDDEDVELGRRRSPGADRVVRADRAARFGHLLIPLQENDRSTVRPSWPGGGSSTYTNVSGPRGENVVRSPPAKVILRSRGCTSSMLDVTVRNVRIAVIDPP